MVKKADGTWRPCGDYRLLNLQLQPDLYMCPYIADLTARLEGCTIFPKLDLRKGFHQIPVRLCNMPKTAGIIPLWVVGVHLRAIWIAECRPDIPALHG